ncbi:MAG: hypothetical protein ACKO2Z_35160 [Sphaerospermopsis kisseleviana]
MTPNVKIVRTQDFNLWRESKNAKLGVRKPDESEYPLDLPFSLEQLLDDDFYGDMNGDK